MATVLFAKPLQAYCDLSRNRVWPPAALSTWEVPTFLVRQLLTQREDPRMMPDTIWPIAHLLC